MSIPTLPTILITAVIGLLIYFFQKFYERMIATIDNLTVVINDLKIVITDVKAQNTFTLTIVDKHEIRLKEIESVLYKNTDLFDVWSRKKEKIIKNIPD